MRTVNIRIYLLLSFFFIGYTASGNTYRIKNLQELKIIQKEAFSKIIIVDDIDLHGEEIKLSTEILSIKKNATLSNGKIIGSGGQLKFKAPFIGDSLVFDGFFLCQEQLKDSKLFTKLKYNRDQLQTMANLSSKNSQILVTCGVFQDVSNITISGDFNIDFQGSTINCGFDKYGLSNNVFLMEPWIGKHYCFIIKNVVIDGGHPTYGLESGIGPRRTAIQLFNTQEVFFDNVSIINFRYGTSGYYATELRKRYMAGICSIMDYKKCTIENCFISGCSGEGFYLVPDQNPDNLCIFRKNKALDFYGSLLNLIDGKCVVEENEMEHFGSSGMNIFCYDSIIRNNYFKGGENFNCIDITENGTYFPFNVEISNNKAEGCRGFIMVSGKDITIHDNECSSFNSGTALSIYEKVESCHELFLNGKDSLAKYGVNNIIICNNAFSGDLGITAIGNNISNLSIYNNRIAIEKGGDDSHRGTAIEMTGVTGLKIIRNDINNSYRNSITRTPSYITLQKCKGDILIEENLIKTSDVSLLNESSNFIFCYNCTINHLRIANNNSTIDNLRFFSNDNFMDSNGLIQIDQNNAISMKHIFNVLKKADSISIEINE